MLNKGEWTTYPKKGRTTDNLVVKIDNYNAEGQTMKMSFQKFDTSTKIIGSVSILDVKEGDILMQENYFNEEGLILKEFQAHNVKLVGKKFYEYRFYLEEDIQE